MKATIWLVPLAAAVVLAVPETTVSAAAASWTVLHFPTGTGFQHTLAVGDLNGDGALDVATPNSATASVTVLLGNGDGTLAPYQSYPVDGEPQDVLVADLTGDGVPDLATPDYLGSGVTVLQGLGDGTFAPRVTWPAGPGLISLAAADLDGDDRLDLVVSKEAGSRIAVLPALAAGGFGSAIEVATGAIPHQIGAADFDHDGLPDLALASNGAAAISVHPGNGTHTPGAATSYAAGASPIGLSIADLDLDGDADLLVTNVNAATVSVLLGHGDGTFATAVPYPTTPRPRGMDTGDLDGDGVPDVVIATGYADGDSVLTVYRGVGDGTLALAAHLRLPYRAADCVLADLNGDTRLDIVVSGPQSGVVSVLLNPGGPLAVPGPPVAEHRLALQVHPNPARGGATFRFRSAADAPARLEVFDASGRRVADLGSFAAAPGWRSVTWRAGDATPGLYLVRLTVAGARAGRRVVLLPR